MFYDLQLGTLREVGSGLRWESDHTERHVQARVLRFEAGGFEHGDRVLFLFGNRAAFFAELMAVWRLGGCGIPVDARLTPFELENLARASRARFAVVDSSTDSALVSSLVEAGLTVFDTDDETPVGEPANVSRPGLRLDDDALILFTSGSTGQPKGVVHTHRSLRAKWMALGAHLGHEHYRRTLCLLPTHFGHGLICNALFPLLSGCELVLAPPGRNDLLMRLGELVDEHEITFLSSVPSMWRLALRASKRPERGSLERVHCGSAPLTAHLWDGVRDWTGTDEVFNAYGITETGSWIAGTTGESFRPQDGLIGAPWGALFRVLKTADTAEPLGPEAMCAAGEAGHVWVQTPTLMRGYFERDDLTAAVVRDGWFQTGDIGILDERGRLFLCGREREEINKGGMKIHPADIDAVAERFESVTDVCTFGFEEPAYGQDVGIALVVAEPDEDKLSALHDWMRKHLAEHKLPRRWYLLDEIPRTSRGKLNRQAVMRACERMESIDLAGRRRAS